MSQSIYKIKFKIKIDEKKQPTKTKITFMNTLKTPKHIS